MEVEYQLEPADVAAAIRHHTTTRSWAGKILWPSLLIGVLALTFGGVCLGEWERGRGFPQPEVLLPQMAIAVIALLIAFPLRHRFVAMGAQFRLKNSRAADLLAPHRLAISPEGMSTTTPLHAGMTLWPGVRAIDVTPDHAFFYLSKKEVTVLPRQAFADPREFDEFVNTALRYHEAARASPSPEQL